MGAEELLYLKTIPDTIFSGFEYPQALNKIIFDFSCQ